MSCARLLQGFAHWRFPIAFRRRSRAVLGPRGVRRSTGAARHRSAGCWEPRSACGRL